MSAYITAWPIVHDENMRKRGTQEGSVRCIAAAFSNPRIQSQSLKKLRKTAVRPWMKGTSK